jgi:hypothetical protein
MATKRVKLTGKSRYCRPWPGQLDMVFATDERTGEPDPKGGNYSMDFLPNAESEPVLKALNVKAKAKEGYIKLRRYERHPVLGELGPVKVTGVDEGEAIGNDSDVTVEVDVYDYGDRFGKRAMRWVSLHVDKLVPYEKKEDQSKAADGAVPFDVPVD